MNVLEKADKFEMLVEQERLNLDSIRRAALVDKLSAKYAQEPEKIAPVKAKAPKSVDAFMEKYSSNS